jgi:hypothetical protein
MGEDESINPNLGDDGEYLSACHRPALRAIKRGRSDPYPPAVRLELPTVPHPISLPCVGLVTSRICSIAIVAYSIPSNEPKSVVVRMMCGSKAQLVTLAAVVRFKRNGGS